MTLGKLLRRDQVWRVAKHLVTYCRRLSRGWAAQEMVDSLEGCNIGNLMEQSENFGTPKEPTMD